MTRHNRLRAQTAITPSQPARDLAPLYTWIVITRSLGPICRGRLKLNGRNIGLSNPNAAARSHHLGAPQTGQIGKNP
jgi:hypothetical protein